MNKILITTILFIFSVVSTYGGPVPDTGQTKCYDGTQEITCPQPGEPFYGQDAQYITNPHSYTKLGYGGVELPDNAIDWIMVRDNVTGLIWEVKHNKDSTQNYSDPNDADNTYTWYDSNSATNDGYAGTPGDGTDTEDFINDLNNNNFGGFSDWRLPTIKELPFIADKFRYSPAIDTAYFPDTAGYGVWSNYWSSTTSVYNTIIAWLVNFYGGAVFYRVKSEHYYVRGVRGGQSSDIFVDNGDGTITDTGLMWQKATAPGTYTWGQALSYCEGLVLSGYDDWRLPDFNELQSLVDYGRYNPAIDTAYFPDTAGYGASSNYWSSTTFVYVTSGAFNVRFNDGLEDVNLKPDTYYVRAVRGGQCGSFGDSDGDGICDDGDNSGVVGDNPCTDGNTVFCDDNCPDVFNSDQADTDVDGIGDVCNICGDVYPRENPPDNPYCGDGIVDIFDLLEEIDFILGIIEPSDCQLTRANVPTGTPPYCDDHDEEIDIFDALVMVDMALGKSNCFDYCYFGKIY